MSKENKLNAVIFGASKKGGEAYANISGEYNIIAFCDNDKNKWGTEFQGVKVIPPEQIKEIDVSVIVVASMYWGAICSQLCEMGFQNIILFFMEPSDERLGKYTLLPMCDLDIIKNLSINEGDGALFTSDFERIFGELPAVNLNQEVIYREKNVLFFAYIFPPFGGSGVQRSLKFVKYLRELGWNPIVISCGKLPYDRAYDYSLLPEVPDDITVIRIDDPSPYVDALTAPQLRQVVNLLHGAVNNYDKMSRFLDKIKENNCAERNYLLYPQKFTMWVLGVLAAAPQIIDFSKIDAVYVTSDPYLSTLIGYYLKNKYNKPWVMDFRDKWTQGVRKYVHPEWVTDFEFNIEKNMLDNLDVLITVNPGNIKIYNEVFGLPEDKMRLICNGYDEADFEDIDTSEAVVSDKLRIIYNGISKEIVSNPLVFLDAVNEAIDEGFIDKADIDVEFVGERSPMSLEDKIKSADVHGVVTLKPYAAHLESLKNLTNGNVLLLILLDPKKKQNTYTGKIFEYLRMNRRILAIAPENSTIKGLLEETGAGVLVSPEDKEGIKRYLRDTLMEIKSGKSFCSNKSEIEKYERKNGARRLAEILDNLSHK